MHGQLLPCQDGIVIADYNRFYPSGEASRTFLRVADVQENGPLRYLGRNQFAPALKTVSSRAARHGITLLLESCEPGTFAKAQKDLKEFRANVRLVSEYPCEAHWAMNNGFKCGFIGPRLDGPPHEGILPAMNNIMQSGDPWFFNNWRNLDDWQSMFSFFKAAFKTTPIHVVAYDVPGWPFAMNLASQGVNGLLVESPATYVDGGMYAG